MGSVVSCEQNGSRLDKCLGRKNTFNKIGTPTCADIYAPFFSACVAGFQVSVWFAGSGSSTCTVNSEPWHRVCSLTHANTRERNAHTGRYLSFFWDRLSSMYLYFWYCSSSFVRTASAVSLPGCFIKDSTSSCKKCDQGVSVCFNSQHMMKRKTKQTKQKSVVDDLCCESNIKNYRC